jgi:hypothetical protein
MTYPYPHETYERISWYGARILKDIHYDGYFDAIYVETPDDKDFIVEYKDSTYKIDDLSDNQYPNPRLENVIMWLELNKYIKIDIFRHEESNSWAYKIESYGENWIKDNRISEFKYDFDSMYLACHRAVLMVITILKDIELYQIDSKVLDHVDSNP